MSDEFENCIALNTVMAARAMTRRYDQKLRPFGVSVAQFTVLGAVRNSVESPVSEMAKRIMMDRTTMLRNLEHLEKKGLVATKAAEKRNGRVFELTIDGNILLDQLIPKWRQAQAELNEVLKPYDKGTLLASLRLLAAG